MWICVYVETSSIHFVVIVSVVNQKGSVGKTTTTLGLASAIAAAGPQRRVLVLDLDPQANATVGLGIVDPEWTTADVLHSATKGSVAGAVTTTDWERVDAVPADLSLAERETDTSLGSEFALREALKGPVLDYDIILIDCPPSVGRLTQNALIASTHALIVTEPSRSGLRGVAEVSETISTIRKHHNKTLKLVGIIVNLMPPKGREAQLRLDELMTELGSKVWEPPIPSRAVLAEAMVSSSPVHAFGADARAVVEVLNGHAAHLLTIVDRYSKGAR
jgi:chromosome partitioning protein